MFVHANMIHIYEQLGPLPVARQFARSAQEAGADARLLMPPYLTPLADPTPRRLAELARIIDAGLAVVGEAAVR